MQRSDQKLCLQWNDFQQNLSSAFRDLREDKEFTDVTLACEDGQQVESHKVVLMSSSPFFRNLLQRNKHPHPLIYMRGVKSEDLVAMTDFLYIGEANVSQENLESFLAIAEELQLKGLHGSQTEAVPTENPLNTRAPKNQAKNILSRGTVKEEEGETFKPHPIQGTSINMRNYETNHETAVALKSDTDLTDVAELREKVKSMILFTENFSPGGKKGRQCKVCGKEESPHTISHHIEANHITGIALPCNVCGKTLPTRNALAQHKMKCNL